MWYCRKRFLVVGMGFCSVFLAHSMRSILNLSITEMVVAVAKNHTTEDPDACPGVVDSSRRSISTLAKHEWSESQQTLLIGAFYWLYGVGHIAGVLADKYGGKHVLGAGVLANGVLTLMTPVTIKYGGLIPAVILRALMGLFQGGLFPALNTLLAMWSPPTERATMMTIVYSGIQVGNLVSNTVAGYMIVGTGGYWPSVFYLAGLLAVVWNIVWFFLGQNSPDQDPTITEQEKAYLKETIHTSSGKDKPPVPWKHIFKSRNVAGLILAQIGHDYCLFGVQSLLPKYMSGPLKFSTNTLGLLSSLPFLFMWFVALGSGVLSDYLDRKKVMSPTIQRKIGTTLGSFVPAIGVIAASYAGCHKLTVASLFCLGMAFMGFYFSSYKVNVMEISPNNAGLLMALTNGIGSTAGIAANAITGVFIPQSTLKQWRHAFWFLFGVTIGTTVIYLFISNAKVEPWDDLRTAPDAKEPKA